MTERTNVLVTGAAGAIGSVLRRGWTGVFGVLRLADVRPLWPAAEGEELVELDLSEFEAVRDAMVDVEVVAHLAAIGAERPFPHLLEANVRATYNVFEAARQAGVRRVVFASTNHVTGFYPRSQQIGPNDPVRPDTVYAATKVFGEALGRLYSDKFGLEVVCVRIGAFSDAPPPGAEAMWLSHRDAVALFTRCVTARVPSFLIVYGVSATSERWWDDASARLLGYEPADRADGPREAELPHRLQGGPYVDRAYHSHPDDAPREPDRER